MQAQHHQLSMIVCGFTNKEIVGVLMRYIVDNVDDSWDWRSTMRSYLMAIGLSRDEAHKLVLTEFPITWEERFLRSVWKSAPFWWPKEWRVVE